MHGALFVLSSLVGDFVGHSVQPYHLSLKSFVMYDNYRDSLEHFFAL